jgi:hypothetical protein
MLRLCCRSTLLPEIHEIIGEQCFAKLMDILAGVTVTFPSKSALEKMRKSRQFLNGSGNAGPSSLRTEEQLFGAVLEEHHVDSALYTP